MRYGLHTSIPNNNIDQSQGQGRVYGLQKLQMNQTSEDKMINEKAQMIKGNSKERRYSKKTFQIINSAGKLLIEVNAFEKYYFVIVAYSNLLKIDGGMQIIHPTPFSPHPTVLNIVQADLGDEIGKKLGKELNCPIVLSINIELSLNKQGQEQLYQAMLQVLRSMQ